nr:cysteine-rich KTR domain-containing protein [Acutalibacter sp. M00118]
MQTTIWVICPKCGKKTHTKLREDTMLTNFPLYCPKCRQERIISANEFKVRTIKEDRSESQTQ